RVGGGVANFVGVGQEWVGDVDRRPKLREVGPGVEAAVDVDVEGDYVVVRDAYLGRLVGGDPLAVMAGDRGARDVLAPRHPAILAGADRDIRQAEARDVEVVKPVGVRLRRGAQVRIAAARSQAAE